VKKLLRLALFAAVLKAGYSLVQKRRSTDSLPAGAPFAPATVPTRTTRPEPRPEELAPSAGDDLTVVKGIGPVYAKKLEEIDITDLAGLAAADAATLADSLSVSEDTISNWQTQAEQLRS
jgi:predicted flap endonuclease-1-like 5' DNA nuclease